MTAENLTDTQEELIPLVLDRLANDELKKLYSENIYPYFSSIMQIPDEFDVVVAELKTRIPTDQDIQNILGRIQSLNQVLAFRHQQSLHYFQMVKTIYQQILKQLVGFVKKTQQWNWDYIDLTEGLGQFEEYDSMDPDYDPKAAKAFSKRLSNKYIVEMIEDTPGLPTIEKFVESLSDLKNSMRSFLLQSGSIFEQTETVFEIKELLDDILSNTEDMRGVLDPDNIDDDDDYKMASAASEKAKMLQSGFDEFSNLYDALHPLVKSWTALTDALENFEETQNNILVLDNNISSELILLRQRIEAYEKYKSDSSKNALITIDKKTLEPTLAILIKKLFAILFRDELIAIEAADSTNQLKNKMDKIEEGLKLAMEKSPSPLTIDKVRFFIALVRIHRKMSELEKKQELALITIAKPIVFALPEEMICFSGHYMFAHSDYYVFAHTKNNEVFGIYQDQRKNSMDSPLSKLVGSLDVPIGSLNGFLHLSFTQSHSTLSRYDIGLLSVLGISPQKVATPDTFKKITQQRLFALPEQVETKFSLIVPKSLEYLKKFIPKESYGKSPKLLEFDEETENFYMALTMYLVQIFLDLEFRQYFQIPNGHPVVCLIVSEEGEILSWAVNTVGVNRTSHAETNALHVYFMKNPNQQNLPDGVRIFSSLKSCQMCSGGILDSLNPQTAKPTKIIYGQDDPGQRNTYLSDYKIESKSKLKIDSKSAFKDIDETHSKEKKNQNRNAAESLYTEAQRENLKKISSHFITTLSSAEQPTADSIKTHIKYFLDVHSLNVTQIEKARLSSKTGSRKKSHTFSSAKASSQLGQFKAAKVNQSELVKWTKILKRCLLAVEEEQKKLKLEERLKQEAQCFGFTCKDVLRDGDCFFHAILDQLKKVNHPKKNLSKQDMKDQSVQYIIDNIQAFCDFLHEDPNQFIDRISTPGEWADHPLIVACAYLLNINIVIVRSDGNDPTIIKIPNATNTVYLGYQVGFHYQSLEADPTINPTKDIQQFIQHENTYGLFMAVPQAGASPASQNVVLLN